jgi:hypothetical protein
MSLGNSMKNLGKIPEALTLLLMVSSIFAISYLDVSFEYKVGIMVLVFAVVILTSIATQILRVQQQIKQGKTP